MRTTAVTCLLTAALAASPACKDDDAGNGALDAATADSGVPADAGVADRGPTVDGAVLPGDAASGDGCGYQGTGTPLTVAPGIELCLPQVTCTAETCPPPLGECVDGRCRFKGAYKGLQTLPEAWATHYCGLAAGGCHGVTQVHYAEVTAQKVSQALGLPLCDGASGDPTRCVGISASPPMQVGNSQEALDPATGKMVALWGLGYTEASGLCYELQGPGATVVVALTDRCGGYCKCKGSGYQECGPCVSAADMAPHCPCVGSAPGLFDQCCGMGCGETKADCDWCASNNHPHFDLDTEGFNRLCGAEAINGSCKLSAVRYFKCLEPEAGWPPGGGGAGCKEGSFWCEGPADHQVQVPGTSCCCNWDLQPQPDGTCS